MVLELLGENAGTNHYMMIAHMSLTTENALTMYSSARFYGNASAGGDLAGDSLGGHWRAVLGLHGRR